MNHLCEGIAFVMNEYEFMEILLPKYLEKIGCDVSSVFCEDDEVIYLENSSGIELEIERVIPDTMDYAMFKPFMVNGKPNAPASEDEDNWRPVTKDYISEGCFVCFADRNMTDVDLFLNPYRSYAELVAENLEKFGEYFPDDFDWDAHIGNFSFSEED